MRTVLICHADDAFDRRGLASWLASFSTLAGVVVLEETGAQKRQRYLREFRRVGLLGMLDVAAMRVYQRIFQRRADQAWFRHALAAMEARYGPTPEVRELHVARGGDRRVVAFLHELRPDIVLARCKQLLPRKVFSIPRDGTFVMHPGICPEYRNAHGCFWAIAERDLGRVGMTLLRIDAGIDTGPVFGHYRYDFDERRESHAVIQARVVLENLDALAVRFAQIHAGTATPVDTAGRRSGEWGQPRLSRHLRARRAMRVAEVNG
ncbi:formyltransferase family protein [Alkalisalibacterium limincola]|uniref:Formyl transferase n=1 Tax=Alkalisalibacterium limincola TaxID=2699169 RepID=A0A5C8KZZ1_9GAMM|nr:formyltransferase family protein [Alkalisalibacterium limincola]TXK65721.1 formyl transferase [Alkalisalibacterium limincola]